VADSNVANTAHYRCDAAQPLSISFTRYSKTIELTVPTDQPT
jgi:hypothetical protein